MSLRALINSSTTITTFQGEQVGKRSWFSATELQFWTVPLPAPIAVRN
jgi:hypothetical protein